MLRSDVISKETVEKALREKLELARQMSQELRGIALYPLLTDPTWSLA